MISFASPFERAAAPRGNGRLRAPISDGEESSTGRGLRLVCRDLRQRQPTCVTFSRYLASLVVRRRAPLPVGYGVPSALESLIGVLHRHGFASSHCRAGESPQVEKLRIEPARLFRGPDRSVRKVVLAARPMSSELDRYELFPTQQRGGDALAVFLEPESKHGLHRFPAMQEQDRGKTSLEITSCVRTFIS